MAVIVADTDKKLRDLLSLEWYVPDDVIYIKITEEDFNSPCPEEFGDTSKTMGEQFYTVQGIDGYYFVPGRNFLANGIPVGAYKKLSFDEFYSYVSYYGVENFYIKPNIGDVIL